jgi:hypothetical protein
VLASVEGFIVPEQSFVPASFRLDRKPGGESESEDDGCVLAPALGDGQVARTIAFFEDLSGMVGATVADATVEGDVVQGPPADQGSVTPADPRVERELEELNQIQLTVAEGLKQLRIETASIAGSQMLPAIAHTSSGSLPDCELRSYGSRGMFSVEARGSVHRFGQPAPRGAVVITPEQLRLCGPLPGCSLLLVPVPIQSTANESLFPLPLLTGLPVPVGSSSLASVPAASGVGALAAAENPPLLRRSSGSSASPTELGGPLPGAPLLLPPPGFESPIPPPELGLIPVPVQSTADGSFFPVPLSTRFSAPVGSRSLASVCAASSEGARAPATQEVPLPPSWCRFHQCPNHRAKGWAKHGWLYCVAHCVEFGWMH